jgi:hypothetical protein
LSGREASSARLFRDCCNGFLSVYHRDFRKSQPWCRTRLAGIRGRSVCRRGHTLSRRSQAGGNCPLLQAAEIRMNGAGPRGTCAGGPAAGIRLSCRKLDRRKGRWRCHRRRWSGRSCRKILWRLGVQFSEKRARGCRDRFALALPGGFRGQDDQRDFLAVGCQFVEPRLIQVHDQAGHWRISAVQPDPNRLYPALIYSSPLLFCARGSVGEFQDQAVGVSRDNDHGNHGC